MPTVRHRSVLKQKNKPFKNNKHKKEKSRSVAKETKLLTKKQKKTQNKERKRQNKRPQPEDKEIAVFHLSPTADSPLFFFSGSSESESFTYYSERFRKRLFFKHCLSTNPNEIISRCMSCDTVLFIVTVTRTTFPIDETILPLLKQFGIPNTITVFKQDSSLCDISLRATYKKFVHDFVAQHFPDTGRVFCLGIAPPHLEEKELERLLFFGKTKEPEWRRGRGMMTVDNWTPVSPTSMTVSGRHNGCSFQQPLCLFSGGHLCQITGDIVREAKDFAEEELAQIENAMENSNEKSEEEDSGEEGELLDETESDSEMEVENLQEKYAEYRGVENIREVTWNQERDEYPAGYDALFNHSYRRQRKTLEREERKPSSSTTLHITFSTQEDLQAFTSQKDKILCGLFPFEEKQAIGYFEMTFHSNLGGALSNGTALIFYLGARRIEAPATFSLHGGRNIFLLKEEVFPGETVFVSIQAPVQYTGGVLVFQKKGEEEILIGSGPISEYRNDFVLLKRVTLVGRVLSTTGKHCVVHRMFSCPEDVKYFQPIELVTTTWKRGHINESLGLHGRMKCIFNKRILASEKIFLHLYKRVFP